MRNVGRRQAACSRAALTLAAVLNTSGCLRFAYHELARERSSTQDGGLDGGFGQDAGDASTQPDAQLTAAGGGVGGSGGRAAAGGVGGAVAGSAAKGGTGGQSSAGGGASDAGMSSDGGAAAAGRGGTAGGGGAGGTGSGGALPFELCTPGGDILFCNGFEEAAPWEGQGLWDYSYFKDSGTGERDTVNPYHGQACAHMSTTLQERTTAARVAFTGLNQRKSGDIWLRYYYYLPYTVVIDPYFSAGVMSELSGKFYGFSLLIYPTTIQLESAMLPSNISADFMFPRNTWVCVEHHVFADPTNGVMEIYIDGVNKLKASNVNSIPDGGWATAEVGIHYVGENQGPVDVYVDNAVVSTARYGCD